MKKTLFILLIAILLCCHVTASFALPAPESAHYPRCGELTLSSQTEINNTYAFRAPVKNDSSVVFEVQGGYAQEDGTAVSVQMFVINRWGNWVAFGKPKTLILNAEATTATLRFPIRVCKPFCIVVSSFGYAEDIVIPYRVYTK